jgi:hypothetical protein
MDFRLNKDVMVSLFGNRHKVFDEAIQHCIKGAEKEFQQYKAGHRFNLLAYTNCVVKAGRHFNVEGNSRVSVNFYDTPAPDLSGDIAPGVPTLRLDIPTLILRDKSKPLFWLYNIRFQLMTPDADVDSRGMRPFRVGYFGITKRGVFERFKEHQSKVSSGTGHILHKAWRGLEKSETPYHPVVQISATSTSLDKIYDLEEFVVGKVSLSPMGLNAIPGGYAGIKMLHQLALLSKKDRILPDERDEALESLERSPNSKCTHYRSGHMRNLQSGKSVWVSPCWINLSKEAVL